MYILPFFAPCFFAGAVFCQVAPLVQLKFYHIIKIKSSDKIIKIIIIIKVIKDTAIVAVVNRYENLTHLPHLPHLTRSYFLESFFHIWFTVNYVNQANMSNKAKNADFCGVAGAN